MIEYLYDAVPKHEMVEKLYNENEWVAYTKDMPKLMEAIKNSLAVITAWDGDDLVGLLRAVGDGKTILYVQDILVQPSYQRQGIGKKLISMIFEHYKDVRQKVLLTDDTEKTRKFYESVGMKACDDLKLMSFIKID